MLYLEQSLTSGAPAYGCRHMAEWLPQFNRLGIQRGLIKHNFDVVQAAGGAPASGGTHLAGTCIDISVIGRSYEWVREVAMLAREAGAPATWPRGDAGGHHWDSAFTGNNHIHAALNCGCADNPAHYQTVAVESRCNGLGAGGFASPDPLPAPTAWRTSATGYAWMSEQLATQTSPAKVATTKAVSTVTIDPNKVAAAVVEKLLTQKLGRSGPSVSSALQATSQVLDALSKE